MFDFYKKWLLNVSTNKKFIPMQLCSLILMVCIGIVYVVSIKKIDSNTDKIIAENLSNRVMLQVMRSYMWECRVFGRDILLQSNEEEREKIYSNYQASFARLDKTMDEFLLRLSPERQEEFKRIIEEKNVYKEAMLLSAEIKLSQNDFDKALEALRSVTPIATAFFKSLDNYYAFEVQLMEEALEQNSHSVNNVIIFGILITVFAALVLYLLVKYSVNIIVKQLYELLDNVTKISNTGNMKIPISERFFTNDEVGVIARVINKFKNMLLEYSFKDFLTQGYNTTAYHNELFDLFEDENNKDAIKTFWCLNFDINNLKKINDFYGHIAGDNAIKEAHTILVDCFSDLGKVYRVGGDEFICIIKKTSEKVIQDRIEKMKEAISIKSKELSEYFAIACGYGFFEGRTREEFDKNYALIDQKMYKDKDKMKQSRPQARVNS